MIDSFGRRLRLAFRSSEDARDDNARVVVDQESDLAPAIDFVAFGEECLLSGRLKLSAERLTDMLNAHDEYQLMDVLVERFDGEPAVEVDEVLVHRDEILLVQAAGPRGSQGRRQRTRQHLLDLQVGPYHVQGFLHALPGSDPINSMRRRKTMVPLTDAWIEFAVGAIRQHRPVGTLLVNREQLDWVKGVVEEEITLPELPKVKGSGPMVKDFTGDIRGDVLEPAAS